MNLHPSQAKHSTGSEPKIDCSLPIARVLFCLGGLAIVPVAQAHPGHPALSAGAGHLLSSPYHLMVLGVLGLCLFAGASLLRRTGLRHALRGAGVVLLAAAGLAALG